LNDVISKNILRSFRGIAFPQKSIKFKIISTWECFAQKLKLQGYAINRSEEVFIFFRYLTFKEESYTWNLVKKSEIIA